jgi:heme-degrading monooxygenase HmoA
MFGRQVTMKLKSDAGWEFIRLYQTVVNAILLEQPGFLSETIHMNSERSSVIVNSLWDSREHEASYDKTGYLQTLKLLADVVEGTPMVKTFELAIPSFELAIAA